MVAEKKQKEGAEADDTHHTPGIDRVELAHFPVGIFGGDGGDHRADEHLRKAPGHREDDGADDKAEIHRPGEKPGPQGVKNQAGGGKHRGQLHRHGNVEFVGEEGKNQVDGELGAKIHQHQKTQKGVGDAVKLPEGEKQHRGQVAHHRHGDVGGVAG